MSDCQTSNVFSGVATGSQLPQISEGCNLLVATPGRSLQIYNYTNIRANMQLCKYANIHTFVQSWLLTIWSSDDILPFLSQQIKR